MTLEIASANSILKMPKASAANPRLSRNGGKAPIPMRTKPDVINRNESVKISRKALGAALDATERAVDVAEAAGDRHYKHDFEADDGRLQHNSAGCPWCDLRRARSAYFAAVRVPVLERNKSLDTWSLPAEGTARRMSRVAHCRKAQRAAQSAYATAATARARCDAAAQMEQAESDFTIVFEKTLRALPQSSVLQEANAAAERKQAAEEALETATLVGTHEEILAAELALDAARAEEELVRCICRQALTRLMGLAPVGSQTRAALAAQLRDFGNSADVLANKDRCHA